MIFFRIIPTVSEMHQERLVALSFSLRHFAEGFNRKSRDEFQFAIGTDKTRRHFIISILPPRHFPAPYHEWPGCSPRFDPS